MGVWISGKVTLVTVENFCRSTALQQAEKCVVYSISLVLGKCLCAHPEPSPNGSQLISLALSTNVVCIGSLVKEYVWESPGSRNGLCVNLCCSSAQGKWHNKLCSELVSQSHCRNLREGKGRTVPKAEVFVGCLNGKAHFWLLMGWEFPMFLYLCVCDLKARALLIPAMASALACFLSKQMPQLEIQPWHMVIEGQGRARGAVVKHLFVVLRSIGWLGVLAILLSSASVLDWFVVSDLSRARYLLFQDLCR